jgi:transglutaminase-like putative cysteine protease
VRRVGRRTFLGGVGGALVLGAPLAPSSALGWSGGRGRNPAVAGVIGDLAKAVGPDPRRRARAAYAYVRDGIRYALVDDAVPPEELLRTRRGHALPQARLLNALLEGLSIRSRIHLYTLNSELWDGLTDPRLPAPRILHAVTEVQLDGHWLELDAYLLDPALRRAAQARLRAEGRPIGYGDHLGASGEWDGYRIAVGALDPSRVLADHGTVASDGALLGAPAYLRHRRASILRQRVRAPAMNQRLRELRASG